MKVKILKYIPEIMLEIVEKDGLQYFSQPVTKKSYLPREFLGNGYKTIMQDSFDFNTNTFVAIDKENNFFHISSFDGKPIYSEKFIFCSEFGNYDPTLPELAMAITEKDEYILINTKGEKIHTLKLNKESNCYDIDNKNLDFIKKLKETTMGHRNRFNGFYEVKDDYFNFIENLLNLKLNENQKQEINKTMTELFSIYSDSIRKDILDDNN